MYEKCNLNFTYYMRRAIFKLNINYQNICWKYWTAWPLHFNYKLWCYKILSHSVKWSSFSFYSVHFLVLNSEDLFTQPLSTLSKQFSVFSKINISQDFIIFTFSSGITPLKKVNFIRKIVKLFICWRNGRYFAFLVEWEG